MIEENAEEDESEVQVSDNVEDTFPKNNMAAEEKSPTIIQTLHY